MATIDYHIGKGTIQIPKAAQDEADRLLGLGITAAILRDSGVITSDAVDTTRVTAAILGYGNNEIPTSFAGPKVTLDVARQMAKGPYAHLLPGIETAQARVEAQYRRFFP